MPRLTFIPHDGNVHLIVADRREYDGPDFSCSQCVMEDSQPCPRTKGGRLICASHPEAVKVAPPLLRDEIFAPVSTEEALLAYLTAQRMTS
jgi:hypothetical protein